MSDPPPSCLRITADAVRYIVNVPLRCTRTTSSHSFSSILKSIRSRKIPATHTTPSMRPPTSIAAATTACAPAIVLMSLATATARPPRAMISSTTDWAISLLGSDPSIDTPKSATTTMAPARAQSKATHRPIPRPPPVTATTLSCRYPDTRTPCLLVIY